MSGSKSQVLYLLLGVGLFAAFVMGFVTGRVSAPSNSKVTPSQINVNSYDRENEDQESNSSSNTTIKTRVVAAKTLSPSAWLKKKRMSQRSAGLTTQAGQKLASGKATLPWEDILNRFRKAYEQPGDYIAQESAEEAINALTIRFSHDQTALKQALSRFSKVHDINEALHFAAIFSRVNDPAVEALASELVTGSQPSYLKAAGFEILRNTKPAAVVQPALETLRSDQDPALRRSALEAIPEASGHEEGKAQELVNLMKNVLEQDSDPEARRRAAILIGSWYRQETDLNCLLQGLKNDPDVNVCASCATACEVSGNRSGFIKAALIAVLDREKEEFIVKENAFRAINRLGPIPESYQASYNKFKDKLEALSPNEQAPEMIESDQQ